jgi:hypothetical protein
MGQGRTEYFGVITLGKTVIGGDAQAFFFQPRAGIAQVRVQLIGVNLAQALFQQMVHGQVPVQAKRGLQHRTTIMQISRDRIPASARENILSSALLL